MDKIVKWFASGCSFGKTRVGEKPSGVWQVWLGLLISSVTLCKLFNFSVSVATFGNTKGYSILIFCQVAGPVMFEGPQGVSQMCLQPGLLGWVGSDVAMSLICRAALLCLPVPQGSQPLQTQLLRHREELALWLLHIHVHHLEAIPGMRRPFVVLHLVHDCASCSCLWEWLMPLPWTWLYWERQIRLTQENWFHPVLDSIILGMKYSQSVKST